MQRLVSGSGGPGSLLRTTRAVHASHFKPVRAGWAGAAPLGHGATLAAAAGLVRGGAIRGSSGGAVRPGFARQAPSQSSQFLAFCPTNKPIQWPTGPDRSPSSMVGPFSMGTSSLETQRTRSQHPSGWAWTLTPGSWDTLAFWPADTNLLGLCGHLTSQEDGKPR